MGFEYEPGPLQPLDPSIVPEVTVNTEMETIVTPTAQQLFEGEGRTASLLSEMHGAGIPDVNGESAHVLRPAFDEIGYQISTEHEMNLSPAVDAVVASLREADGVLADLPSEDSHYEPGPVPGEGEEEENVPGEPPPQPPPETPIN